MGRVSWRSVTCPSPPGFRSLIGTLAPLFLQVWLGRVLSPTEEPRTLLRAFLQPVLVVGLHLGRFLRPSALGSGGQQGLWALESQSFTTVPQPHMEFEWR